MHNTNPAFYLSGNSCFYLWPPLALFSPAIDVLGYLQHLYLGPTILKKGEAMTSDVTCDIWVFAALYCQWVQLRRISTASVVSYIVFWQSLGQIYMLVQQLQNSLLKKVTTVNKFY